jgi:hypothetical protein
MHDLDLAYLAGVIDSDGYITIQRSSHAGRRYYAAKIGIAGTRREPHDLAASMFGGKVSRHVPRRSRHRVQYQWSRSGAGAVVAILAVQPYLRVKGAQACIALELQERVDEARAGRETIGERWPWERAGYDGTPILDAYREEIVEAMAAGGRTWDQFPEEVAARV